MHAPYVLSGVSFSLCIYVYHIYLFIIPALKYEYKVPWIVCNIQNDNNTVIYQVCLRLIDEIQAE